MMLAIGLSYTVFIMLRYIPSISTFIRAFVMKWCWILSKAFSVSIEMLRCFLSLLLLICCITCNDLHMLNHPAFLGWSLLGHGEWSFWYVVGFSLSLFYWGFLHQCSLKGRLIVLSFGCVLTQFQDEYKTGFKEWVRWYSVPFYFLENFKESCY
jgi:hypothetical protein